MSDEKRKISRLLKNQIRKIRAYTVQYLLGYCGYYKVPNYEDT